MIWSAPFAPVAATGHHWGKRPKPMNWAALTAVTWATHISQRPVCWPRRQKARREPSGDQEGCRSWAPSLVSCTALPPSTGITKMSQEPLRSEQKAMYWPSGETAGMTSWPGSSVRRVTTEELMGLM
jgi:hypothetical protein